MNIHTFPDIGAMGSPTVQLQGRGFSHSDVRRAANAYRLLNPVFPFPCAGGDLQGYRHDMALTGNPTKRKTCGLRYLLPEDLIGAVGEDGRGGSAKTNRQRPDQVKNSLGAL